MALIDRILLRNEVETARAEAMREFKRVMPSRGRFSEFVESGITSYYDHRFGRFDPAIDEWRKETWREEPHILKANPQLRRVDVIADSVFDSGVFDVKGLGAVRSRSEPGKVEGAIAAIGLSDRPGVMIGMLTLDIGSEIRFTKMRIGVVGGKDFVVRPSSLDYGMVISPNVPGQRDLPEAINERAAEGSQIFLTIQDTILALERLLRGKSA